MNEIILKSNLIPEILEHFTLFEGRCSHFYLDGPGYVTIGIGCLIPNGNAALKLKMLHKSDNLVALPEEIRGEYKLIKECLPGKRTEFYGVFCKLYLSDSDINALFEVRLNQIIDFLRSQLPEYSKFPDNIKLVVLDMAYNLGVSGLMMKFPRFVQAVRTQNYVAAANECERKQIGDARNQWTKETLLEGL